MDRDELNERLLEVEWLEEERKQKAVEEALAKFNWFLHLTAWLSGCSFLLILGILLDWMLPYVFIPIGLWTIGIAYHAYKAFRPRRPYIKLPVIEGISPGAAREPESRGEPDDGNRGP